MTPSSPREPYNPENLTFGQVMRYCALFLSWIVFLVLAIGEIGGIPVAWWLYALMALAFGLIFFLRRHPTATRRRLLTFGTLIAAMMALYWVPWTTRKPFLHDLYSINPGMTETDVRRIMARYSEGTGWPAIYGVPPGSPGTLYDLGTGASHATGSTPSGELTIESSLVFRHDTTGNFNSDWGIVALKDGKVTSVSFSPD